MTDGFQTPEGDALTASHQLIDHLLSEAQVADDPHHCRLAKLPSATRLASLKDTETVELAEAVLVRAWRIEGLGPRALDEGGVRGWNSIGWLVSLLQHLVSTEVPTADAAALAQVIQRLQSKGLEIFASIGTELPDLAEWINGTARHSGVDAITRERLNAFANLLEAGPEGRSVYSEGKVKRAVRALRAAAECERPPAKPMRSCLFIDRQFVGVRLAQHSLAEALGENGWSFRLQGVWETPPPTSFVDEGKGIKVILVLKSIGEGSEKNPNDLQSDGSCRWVTLDEIRIRWEAKAETASLLPTCVVGHLEAIASLVRQELERGNPPI